MFSKIYARAISFADVRECSEEPWTLLKPSIDRRENDPEASRQTRESGTFSKTKRSPQKQNNDCYDQAGISVAIFKPTEIDQHRFAS
jgi:hypothetical protein